VTLRIADEILRSWQAQVDQGSETGIFMRLAATAPVAEALDALEAAVRASVVERQTVDAPFRGEWTWVASGDDVIVTALECEVLPEVLPELAAVLESRGIDGSLEVHDDTGATFQWPWPLRLVEARLRVRGERELVGGRTYHWNADEQALTHVVDVAVLWCVRARGPSPWLRVGVNPLIEVPPDGLAARVREEMGRAGIVEIRRAGRGVVFDALWGRVSLMDIDARWQRVVPAIADVLREAAGSLAYAFVKGGADPSHVVAGESLEYDWPPRSGVDEHGVQPAWAFEDERAPDAFAVQLLGPGYAGRVPASRLYRAETVTDATLLEHVDPGSWFDAPIVPPDTHWSRIGEVTSPPVLAEARAALAPILFDGSHVPATDRGALPRDA